MKGDDIVADYQVKFNSCGGTLQGVDLITAENGYFLLPDDPVREGYNFCGWAKDILGYVKFNIDELPLKEDLILYALWEPIMHTVVFLDEHGNNDTVCYVKHDDYIEIVPDAVKAGYTFVGWYLDPEFTKKYMLSMPIVDDYTIYPKFAIRTFSVWFDVGDAPTIPTINVGYGETITVDDPPEWYGHIFEGYFEDYLYMVPFDFTVPITEDTTIYVKYEELNVIVKYQDEDGNPVMDDGVFSYGTKISEPKKPTKAGLKFSHWELDGETFHFNINVEQDIILVAIFVEITCLVTFEGNGGELQEYYQHVNYGEKVSCPEDPTKEGSQFICWSTTSVLEDVFNFDLPIFSDMTLYAKWKINTFKVYFIVDAETFDQREVNWGNSVTNTIPLPTKTNYNFVGWYDADDNLFNFSVPIYGDKTVYAKFDKQRVTITFVTLGGSYIEPVVIDIGETVQEPTEPTKLGHVFGGWYENASFTTAFDFSSTLNFVSKILYAKWDICKYEVTINYCDDSDTTIVQEVEFNSRVERPTIVPKLDGHVFDNWVDINGGVFDFSLPITEDTIIEASYREYISGTDDDFLSMINSPSFYDGDDVVHAIEVFIDSYVEDNTVDGFKVEDLHYIYLWACSAPLSYFKADSYYWFKYSGGVLSYGLKAQLYELNVTSYQLKIMSIALAYYSTHNTELMRDYVWNTHFNGNTDYTVDGMVSPFELNDLMTFISKTRADIDNGILYPV